MGDLPHCKEQKSNNFYAWAGFISLFHAGALYCLCVALYPEFTIICSSDMNDGIINFFEDFF